ncbi:hypothetical protein E1A91_D13G159900v1 [Gossypium mustelinum]|uniref:Uncharacterized protein n=1 Tax=Gossypium mustelinum TaxID=34275 RepID=A0A5D2S6B6_GOSMU|nr:hypothetical protein E1A91_D13G159900v1 [Gossypium mustelinum]
MGTTYFGQSANQNDFSQVSSHRGLPHARYQLKNPPSLLME